MEKIIDGIKSGNIWTDNVNVSANTIIPVSGAYLYSVLTKKFKTENFYAFNLVDGSIKRFNSIGNRFR